MDVETPRRPFDVSKLLDPLNEAINQDAYDTPRSRPSLSSEARGNGSVENSRGAAPGQKDDTAPIPPAEDAINPAHYRSHPSGIECIEITRHMNFNTGNAVKYIWRYMDKGDPVENLKKAQWYLDDEIRRLEGLR